MATGRTASRVLVTGATGFVGACLVRRLVERGDEVHIICRPDADTWRLSDLLDDLVRHPGDLRDAEALTALLQKVHPDCICHLATYGGFYNQQDLSTIIATNITGTANLLQAAIAAACPAVILTGSSSEYGHKQEPMRESDLLEPVTLYGASKASATLLGQVLGCTEMSAPVQLRVTTLRLFSPYGPYDAPSRFMALALTACLLARPLPLTQGNQPRDYIYIDDVLAAYLHLVDHPEANGGIYNIGSGVQVTLREVGAVIERVTETSGLLQWGLLLQRSSDSPVWVASISAARERLSWSPVTSLEQGIAQTRQWFQQHPHLQARYTEALHRFASTRV